MYPFSMLRVFLLLGLLSPASIAFSQTLQYQTLQLGPGHYTSAGGVNNLGDIVGLYDPNTVGTGFLYSNGKLQTIGCSTPRNDYAQGINDNRVVVGGCNSPKAYIYQNGVFTFVTYPNAQQTWFTGINNKGVIVGYYVGSGAQHLLHGFVYVNGKFTLLPSSVTVATGINNKGMVAGISCNSSQVCNGVVLTKGSKGWQVQRKVFYPGAANTYVNGINDDGDLAGDWTSGLNVPQQAFVYRKSSNQFVGLDFSNNNNLAIAFGINNAGEIVGEYSPANGGAISGFYGTVQ